MGQTLYISFVILIHQAFYPGMHSSHRSTSIKSSRSRTELNRYTCNGNPLEPKRCSNIPGSLHQSLAKLAQQLKTIPIIIIIIVIIIIVVVFTEFCAYCLLFTFCFFSSDFITFKTLLKGFYVPLCLSYTHK